VLLFEKGVAVVVGVRLLIDTGDETAGRRVPEKAVGSLFHLAGVAAECLRVLFPARQAVMTGPPIANVAIGQSAHNGLLVAECQAQSVDLASEEVDIAGPGKVAARGENENGVVARLSPERKRPAAVMGMRKMLVTRHVPFGVDLYAEQQAAVNILNGLLRPSRRRIAKPRVGEEQVLLVEDRRAIAEPVMEVIPEIMGHRLASRCVVMI
jgi:hypothetical protein